MKGEWRVTTVINKKVAFGVLIAVLTTIAVLFLLHPTSSVISTKAAIDQDSKPYEEISVHADHAKFSNADDLEKDAHLIIVGSPIKKFSDRPHVTKYFPGEKKAIEEFYTITDIIVDKVLKQPADFKLNQANTLQIVEPVTEIGYPDKVIKLKADEYEDVKANSKYIIFLKRNSFGSYYVLGGNMGKYNIDGTDQLDNNIAEEKELKSKLKADILTKYQNQLQ